MKSCLSVLMLAVRSTLYKFIGLLALMTAAEAVLFYFAMQKLQGTEPVGLEELISRSGVAIVCGVCFLLLCALLSVTGCEFGGGKLRYTLRRLSVREETIVFWWAGYYVVCFLIFWAAQLAVSLLLCRLYISQTDPALISDQTVFLAFYRSSFLHSLLPIEEVSRYIRNIVYVLCLGICASCFSFRLRRGEKAIAVIVLAATTFLSFIKPMGDFGNDIQFSVFSLLVAGLAAAGIWKERGDESEA